MVSCDLSDPINSAKAAQKRRFVKASSLLALLSFHFPMLAGKVTGLALSGGKVESIAYGALNTEVLRGSVN